MPGRILKTDRASYLDGEEIVIHVQAVYERPLADGVAFTGTMLRPDGVLVYLTLEKNLLSGEWEAKVPLADLVGRGQYRVVMTCDVAEGATPVIGETFGGARNTPIEPIEVPAFRRDASTSFYLNSTTDAPIPSEMPHSQPVIDHGLPEGFEPVGPRIGDWDGDHIPDPHDGDPSSPDSNGNNVPDDVDTDIPYSPIGDPDGDGVTGKADNCPWDFNPNQASHDDDAEGDACDLDDDNDAVPDPVDNCPLTPNGGQDDRNNNGIGDGCDDPDGDGVADDLDNCRDAANPTQADRDADGTGDACDDSDNDGSTDAVDNCPTVPNPSQSDLEHDGLGDECDPDDDNDAVPDASDNCPGVANATQSDIDHDGQGDACDGDGDGDGVADPTDNCPLVSNPTQADFDHDGIGDACDPNSLVANAGPDQTLECSTPGKALAVLDGRGSGAPSGSLSYAWSAPAAALSRATESVASGRFPLGTSTVTLTVGQGSKSATDTAMVTVIDTKPPVLTAPPDLVAASCTLVSLGQATAQDACGGAVTIVNDAPSSFKAGSYTVTWRAIDQFGNQTTAIQKVVVGLGESTSCCPSGAHVILGTPNNDTLNGTSGVDCIFGKGGQDTINGFGGNDFLSGGDGNDVIDAGGGNDFIDGGTGQDTLRGSTGNDLIAGGDGDDVCYGGIGDDVIRGGQGQDHLLGEDGADMLFGEIGDDVIEGGAGSDLLNGNGLHDQCTDTSGINTFVACANVPPTLPGATVSALLDFTAGFCVTLNVTNATPTQAKTWSVKVNNNQAVIYDSWNGSFTTSTGGTTVIGPNAGFNATLDAGETDSSIGYCANRIVPGSALPTVVSTTATF